MLHPAQSTPLPPISTLFRYPQRQHDNPLTDNPIPSVGSANSIWEHTEAERYINVATSDLLIPVILRKILTTTPTSIHDMARILPPLHVSTPRTRNDSLNDFVTPPLRLPHLQNKPNPSAAGDVIDYRLTPSPDNTNGDAPASVAKKDLDGSALRQPDHTDDLQQTPPSQPRRRWEHRWVRTTPYDRNDRWHNIAPKTAPGHTSTNTTQTNAPSVQGYFAYAADPTKPGHLIRGKKVKADGEGSYYHEAGSENLLYGWDLRPQPMPKIVFEIATPSNFNASCLDQPRHAQRPAHAFDWKIIPYDPQKK